MQNLSESLQNLGSKPEEIVSDAEMADRAARSAFRHDSTFGLVKKLFIYKTMGSNLFINYSLMGMNVAYRLLGVKLTNLVIEGTAGSIFTGGVTLEDLARDIKVLESRGVGGIGCYVVEGLRQIDNKKLDNFLDFSMESIDKLTEGKD